MNQPRSAGRITAGILLIVGGVLGFVVFLVVSLFGFFGAMERVETPGSRGLNLQRGDYTIYWETDSRFHRAPSIGGELEVAVVSGDDSTALAVSSRGLMTSRYNVGSRSGISVGAFSVTNRGAYEVSVRAAAGKTLPAGRVVVSKSMGALGVLKLIGICGALLALGVGGGVSLLVTPRRHGATEQKS